LIPRLLDRGITNIVAIDKHPTNTVIFQKNWPTVRLLRSDLAASESQPPEWQAELAGCDALVIAHAQIGGIVPEEFVRNNINATERLLEAALRHKVPYIVSISSSVVNSMAVDSYTETKKAQEALMLHQASGIRHQASGIRHQANRPASHPHVWLVRPKAHRLARSIHAKDPDISHPGIGEVSTAAPLRW
jgi:nucleoside-diphosphate-sugar epimerase